MVAIDIPARTLEVELSDAELARRRAAWHPQQKALTRLAEALRGDGHIRE